MPFSLILLKDKGCWNLFVNSFLLAFKLVNLLSMFGIFTYKGGFVVNQIYSIANEVAIKLEDEVASQLEHDVELLDSTTSFNKGKVACEKVNELINQIHRILQSLNYFWPRLPENKLTHMQEAKLVLILMGRYCIGTF